MVKRINIKKILADPVLRRELCVENIRAMQAREGIDTTREQAERAYDQVQSELRRGNSCALHSERPPKTR
jgi:hypothetical protein